MHRTNSATPLEKIAIEIDPSGMLSHIWLRQNIEKVTKNDNGLSSISYEADEVYLTIPGVCSVESIAPKFDELWSQAEESESTLNERIAKLEENLNALTALLSAK